MAEVEMLYSARQLSDELDITLQMLSKYAQAYTKLTKRQIKKQGRDGRHFTSEQREVIKNARDAVRSQTGTTVENAMKRALMLDAVPLEVNSWNGTQLDLEALKTVFSEALRQEVTLPLVAEMKALRQEVAELKQGRLEGIEQIAQPAKNEVQDGIIVRLAKRFEKWLGRG
jgi:cell division protein FtsB